MTNRRIRTATLLLMLFSVPACAQPADQQSRTMPKAGPASGGTTLQMFVQRHERKLMADDTDGDGKVSRAEFLAAVKAGNGDPAERFARIDRNDDGVLDRTEIDAMLTRRFSRLDTNGDGALGPDERAAAHQKNGAAINGADT